MTRNCRLTITDAKNGSIIKADARFHVKNGRKYVFFEQPAADGSIPCSLKFDQTGLNYSRHGEFAAELEISKTERTSVEYVTPFGRAGADIETAVYELEETDESIRIEIEYLLKPDAAEAERLNLIISIENNEEV